MGGFNINGKAEVQHCTRMMMMEKALVQRLLLGCEKLFRHVLSNVLRKTLHPGFSGF